MNRSLICTLLGTALILAPVAAFAAHGRAGLWTVTSTMEMKNMPQMPPEAMAMMKARGMPMPGAPLTTASAHTTEGLAMGLARDLAPIRVNAVCLGLIMSEQVQNMGEATIKGYTANLPLPRGGTVEEAAEAYLYLMRATYVTGQVVRVDGGGSLV